MKNVEIRRPKYQIIHFSGKRFRVRATFSQIGLDFPEEDRQIPKNICGPSQRVRNRVPKQSSNQAFLVSSATFPPNDVTNAATHSPESECVS
uniref:Uncharacterized protein n=1 Tax=Steinernema glaseri TaxID=37863 RepID=A0A1I7YKQ7_9BILA